MNNNIITSLFIDFTIVRGRDIGWQTYLKNAKQLRLSALRYLASLKAVLRAESTAYEPGPDILPHCRYSFISIRILVE